MGWWMNKYQREREAKYDELVARFVEECCTVMEISTTGTVTDSFDTFMGWAESKENDYTLRKRRTVRHFTASLRRLQTEYCMYVDDSVPWGNKRPVYLELNSANGRA
jgi:hypothetical protein